MANYKINECAQEDLERLYQYGIQNFGLAQADQYLDSIFERFQQIADEPMMYNTVNEIREGYRRSILGPHSIYYRTYDNGVEIMRLLSREDAGTQLR